MIIPKFYRAYILAGALLAGLATVPDVLAQTNTENFAQFEFNFNSPGARATGIGGAFISIADDATAAEANPAGLTALIRTELSFELKWVEFTRNINNFSHQGTADNFQVVSKEFSNSVVIPSFASVVVPFGRIVASVFRYELVNFEATYYTKGSYIPAVQPSDAGDGSVFFPVRSDMSMKVVNWGAAVAFKISRSLSLGASAGLSQLSMSSNLSRYLLEVFDSGNLANESTISSDENSFFVNAGILVRPIRNLSIGAILKYRPQFSVPHNLLISSFPADTLLQETINFNIPSSVGLGISYSPTDVLTFSFDVVGVKYSDLTQEFITTFGGDFASAADYTVDDAVEFHLGGEYVLLTRGIGFVFRAGFYTEADNRIRFSGDPLGTNDPDGQFFRRTQVALFQAGETDYHYTFGTGFIFSSNVQLDLAANLSTGSNEIVGSFVVRL
jgi:long-subunit fatty acid transport protein